MKWRVRIPDGVIGMVRVIKDMGLTLTKVELDHLGPETKMGPAVQLNFSGEYQGKPIHGYLDADEELMLIRFQGHYLCGPAVYGVDVHPEGSVTIEIKAGPDSVRDDISFFLTSYGEIKGSWLKDRFLKLCPVYQKIQPLFSELRAKFPEIIKISFYKRPQEFTIRTKRENPDFARIVVYTNRRAEQLNKEVRKMLMTIAISLSRTCHR